MAMKSKEYTVVPVSGRADTVVAKRLSIRDGVYILHNDMHPCDTNHVIAVYTISQVKKVMCNGDIDSIINKV